MNSSFTMLLQEHGVPGGKESGNMTTKFKVKSDLIKKRDGVFQGSDSYNFYWGEQWACKVLEMIFKVLQNVKVPKGNVNGA